MSQVDGPENNDAPDEPQPWFARRRRPARVMFYRINRRPRPQPSLFDAKELPFDEHLEETLLFGTAVTTGRRYQRQWRLGNREHRETDERRFLVGRVGFEREAQRATGRYEESEKKWEDEIQTIEEGVDSPFAVDLETRVLAVVRHPDFEPGPVSTVFESLLQTGERQREVPAVIWAVEPILDDEDFFGWIRRTAVVEQVRFVVELPNPDAVEGHEYVNERLDRINGHQIEEKLVSNQPTGLQNLDSDIESQRYLDSARQGFGYVTGRGHLEGGGPTEFDQRRQLARESLPGTPGTWSSLIAALLGTLSQWILDRQEDESQED